MTEEALSRSMQDIRADIFQYSELLSIGIRLSFPAAYEETQFFAMFKRSVRDVIISQLYPSVSQMYRSKLSEKDELMRSQCAVLRDAPLEVSGVDSKFLSITTSLETSEECARLFVESNSVRQKLRHLELLSSSIFSAAAKQLKKIAEEKKGKPSEELSSSKSTNSVDDVMKYSMYGRHPSNSRR